MKKLVFLFSIVVCSSHLLMGQAFDNPKRVRNLQKGWRIGGGVFHSRLVNSSVYKSETLAEGSSGITLGGSYDYAPFGFDAGYYSARITQNRLKQSLNNEKDTARLLLFSASGHLNLLWNSKFIYPYIGAGFQYSNLSSDSIDIHPTNAFIKAGVKIFLNKEKMTLKVDYQRGIPASGGAFKQDDLEMVTVTIGFRLKKPDLRSK